MKRTPFADLAPDFKATPAILERHMQAAAEAIQGRLADPRWRLRNLYSIKPEGGGDPIPFVPRAEQELIYDHFENDPLTPCYIIKSRRLGFSTALGTFVADRAAWETGQNMNLVDITQPDAHKKMREIIRYAVDSMPDMLLNRFEFVPRAIEAMGLRCRNQPDSAVSMIYAGMNARGGDSSFLWISEWAKFQNDAEQFKRSEEIKTGAFPAARKGIRVVESTWKGGRKGHVWELIQPILEGKANAHGKIYFFPWHRDPSCVSITGEVTPEVMEYFQALSEKTEKQFTAEQKKWWAINKSSLTIHMAQEFPSTLDEALSSPGDSPKFSMRGCDMAEKRGKDFPCTYGTLSSNANNHTASFNPSTQDDASAWLRVFERPMPGHHYIQWSDLCTGQMTITTDPDFHAGGIIRAAYKDGTGTIHPPVVAAAIRVDDRAPLDVYARQLTEMAWYYGDCISILEINKHSGFVELCRACGMGNVFERTLYPDAKGDKQERREPGWITTETNKPIITDTLGNYLREEGIIIPCERMVTECRQFQINLKALGGYKDDWVMGLSMGLHHLHLATRYMVQIPQAPLSTMHHPYAQPGGTPEEYFAPDQSYGGGNFAGSVLG